MELSVSPLSSPRQLPSHPSRRIVITPLSKTLPASESSKRRRQFGFCRDSGSRTRDRNPEHSHDPASLQGKVTSLTQGALPPWPIPWLARHGARKNLIDLAIAYRLHTIPTLTPPPTPPPTAAPTPPPCCLHAAATPPLRSPQRGHTWWWWGGINVHTA